MANYYASERTNYFRVKDEVAFRQFADRFNLTVIDDSEGRFGLLPGNYTDDGTFPTYLPDTDEDFDFLAALSEHLEKGSIAVRVQAGAEKLRYICGFAEAINHQGKTCHVSINSIYDLAAKELGGEVTVAEY
jgi:hypothetical protein